MDDSNLHSSVPPTEPPAAAPTFAAEPDVAAERQARLDYYRSVNPPAKSRKGLKIAGLVLLTVVLAAAGFGAYWHFSNAKPAAKNSPVAQHQAASQAESAANQKVATKSYSSTNFMVGINYPEDWTVADAPTDLSVTSPVTQITDATGAKVSARIIMNMVPKGSVPTAFGSGATAVLDSVKVNYTQPTATQRASTYLSFAQYPATTTTGALDGVYVTGNNGYKKDQNIPSSDIATVDPLISVTFEKCTDTVCAASRTPLSIQASDWQDTAFSAPITTLLTSLSFQ